MDKIMLNKMDTIAFRDRWIDLIQGLQNEICLALEEEDGHARFKEDQWERAAGKGGGGKTRVIEKGQVFEKAAVNTSVVFGKLTDPMRKQLKLEGDKWFASGISIVLHPRNPFIPTVHANWRYFELYHQSGQVIDRWFGGGSDLTPYYLFEEDATHFHQTLKNAMDPFGEDLYPRCKQQCDEYFSNTHRNKETRGIGGVFYDHLRMESEQAAENLFRFQQANGEAFLKAYLPIVQRRKQMAYGEREIEWQEIRRGRYVEFNLLHDRGTIFGLKTNGRTESILMSLPPRARWLYNHQPAAGSAEEKLFQVCLHPRDWCVTTEEPIKRHKI
jgi:coproporphyrinogen III oxidase